MNWHISCVNSYMKLYIISNRLPVKVTNSDFLRKTLDWMAWNMR